MSKQSWIKTCARSLIYPVGCYSQYYSQYVGWSFISNIFLSAESVLSTHSMLNAIGYASNSLIITSNYIGKDIVGQLGGLVYINKMGKQADAQPRKFLMYSNIFQQSAILIECITPLIPTYYFIAVAGGANIAKNISFTGIGAINAKCIQKLAIDNNIGQIYAKISILNTLGSSIGMLIGLLFATQLLNHTLIVGLIPFLAVARIYTFRRAIKGLI